MVPMTALDQIALTVELTVVSIIEGVALGALATNAAPVFQDGLHLQYVPYIFAGLALLLVFWSQAILHAISFIRWPLRMDHMLLYFLAAFLQVLIYSNITNSVQWFFWGTLFSLVVLWIYFIDLRILREVVPMFSRVAGGADYIHEVLRRHVNEMKFLMPISIAFNIVALILVVLDGAHNSWLPITLGTLQVGVSFGALVDCVRNFKDRSARLPAIFASEQ